MRKKRSKDRPKKTALDYAELVLFMGATVLIVTLFNDGLIWVFRALHMSAGMDDTSLLRFYFRVLGAGALLAGCLWKGGLILQGKRAARRQPASTPSGTST